MFLISPLKLLRFLGQVPDSPGRILRFPSHLPSIRLGNSSHFPFLQGISPSAGKFPFPGRILARLQSASTSAPPPGKRLAATSTPLVTGSKELPVSKPLGKCDVEPGGKPNNTTGKPSCCFDIGKIKGDNQVSTIPRDDWDYSGVKCGFNKA